MIDAEYEGYYLSQDQDGHWYIIPVEYKDEWGDFLDLDPNDEESWDVPDWAEPIGGSPSLVVFHSYEKV